MVCFYFIIIHVEVRWHEDTPAHAHSFSLANKLLNELVDQRNCMVDEGPYPSRLACLLMSGVELSTASIVKIRL